MRDFAFVFTGTATVFCCILFLSGLKLDKAAELPRGFAVLFCWSTILLARMR